KPENDGVSARTAPIVVIDPLVHPAWDTLVAAHPRSSFFHSAGWARVLNETYGHRPFYVCRYDGEALRQLLPLMEVSSFCLGRRGVSLPFTDFCTPLSAEAEDSRALRDYAVQHGRARGWQYLEWRGPTDVTPCPKPSLAFYGHVLDL